MYQIVNTNTDSLSELHLNYDGTRVFAFVSRYTGSNYTKMYATADGPEILFSNEKNPSYRVFYLQSQGLWYLISQTNSQQLNCYRASNLANLTMAPYTVTNVACKPFSPLQLTIKIAVIYKIASNGNDVIAASIAYNTSSTTPSIFIHNTSKSLLLTIVVTYIHSCHTTPCSHHLYH